MTFKPGDLVVKNTKRSSRTSRREYIPGKQGSVGGSAASHMREEQVYRVLEITSNGGVMLHGFSLIVSAKELVFASEAQIEADNQNPVSASSSCRERKSRCWNICYPAPYNLSKHDRSFSAPNLVILDKPLPAKSAGKR